MIFAAKYLYLKHFFWLTFLYYKPGSFFFLSIKFRPPSLNEKKREKNPDKTKKKNNSNITKKQTTNSLFPCNSNVISSFNALFMKVNASTFLLHFYLKYLVTLPKFTFLTYLKSSRVHLYDLSTKINLLFFHWYKKDKASKLIFKVYKIFQPIALIDCDVSGVNPWYILGIANHI